MRSLYQTVKWPHEYVLSSSQKEHVSYDQLSVLQWVTGFCRIMRDEQNRDIPNSMLDYLIAHFDDANDFSWDTAKASHAVILCRMEQGEIKHAQVKKINRIRRTMLKGMFLRSVHPLSIQALKSIQPKPPKVCRASITTRVRVSTSNPMTCAELFTGISALIASPLLVRHLFTPNHSAAINRKNRQKTNNIGYESQYPYPLVWHTSFSYHKHSLTTRIVEFDTDKQKALQWYRMQRALWEKSPFLSYAEVIKKQSTSLGKQSLQTSPRITSVHNVKASRDHSQDNVGNSALQTHNLAVLRDQYCLEVKRNTLAR